MISEIITNIKTFNITILRQFIKQILIKLFKMILNFPWINRLSMNIDTRSNHIRTLVHVGEEDSRAYAWLSVETRTSIAVTTCSDLEVEWTVNAVFLCAEN
ncbi:hypothetical protein MtrunA17_Chr2g0320811 [Medicago truncatula]|uniref:Uncharacterized protein n=1 Tax=Medicago truncatula TaxID=3880 RepID=A0A396JFE3_MEDTR|nr:hypothetical protein MtrunA17_Chr2g0320811 [Medicago truncatula]